MFVFGAICYYVLLLKARVPENDVTVVLPVPSVSACKHAKVRSFCITQARSSNVIAYKRSKSRVNSAYKGIALPCLRCLATLGTPTEVWWKYQILIQGMIFSQYCF